VRFWKERPWNILSSNVAYGTWKFGSRVWLWDLFFFWLKRFVQDVVSYEWADYSYSLLNGSKHSNQCMLIFTLQNHFSISILLHGKSCNIQVCNFRNIFFLLMINNIFIPWLFPWEQWTKKTLSSLSGSFREILVNATICNMSKNIVLSARGTEKAFSTISMKLEY